MNGFWPGRDVGPRFVSTSQVCECCHRAAAAPVPDEGANLTRPEGKKSTLRVLAAQANGISSLDRHEERRVFIIP